MKAFIEVTSGPCAGLSDYDRTILRNAARQFANARGATIRLAELLGLTLGKAARLFGNSAAVILGNNWERKYQSLVEQALRQAFDLATLGLDPEGQQGALGLASQGPGHRQWHGRWLHWSTGAGGRSANNDLPDPPVDRRNRSSAWGRHPV